MLCCSIRCCHCAWLRRVRCVMTGSVYKRISLIIAFAYQQVLLPRRLPNFALNGLHKALSVWRQHENGWHHSCGGTTKSIATVPCVSSHQVNGIEVKTRHYLESEMPSIEPPKIGTPIDGLVTRETGSQSERLYSIMRKRYPWLHDNYCNYPDNRRKKKNKVV